MSLLDRNRYEFDLTARIVPEAQPLDASDLIAIEEMRITRKVVEEERQRRLELNLNEPLTTTEIMEIDKLAFGRGIALAVDEAMSDLSESVD
ncbi:hypothetical protein H0X10_03800 [Candidatus Saccharibacteria bacterium]|nr:hypothetical protein [Candidatus Saccharibacteria bacterium]